MQHDEVEYERRENDSISYRLQVGIYLGGIMLLSPGNILLQTHPKIRLHDVPYSCYIFFSTDDGNIMKTFAKD